MEQERAYIYLEHMKTMLEHGNIAALRLEEAEERNQYAEAINNVLVLLESQGVMVDRTAHQE